MGIRIRLYQRDDANLWNEFAIQSRMRHFFFQREYMEYHKDRFEDYSLLFFDEKQRLIALLPATKHGGKLVSHGGLTFGGFLVGHRMTASLMLEAMTSLKCFLVEQGFTELIYKCIPYIYTQYPSEEDRYALFRNNAELIRRDISTTILLPNRYAYSKLRRRMVNKGKRHSIHITESKDYILFISMMNSILEKYHGTQAVHTGQELSMLAERFPKNIHLYVGELDGKMEAGTVIFENGDVVHTQYLANSDVGRENGALDCVIDHLIYEVYADRKYFDFGISNEKEGRYLNEGLIAQKEGFGARAIAHDFYRLQLQL